MSDEKLFTKIEKVMWMEIMVISIHAKCRFFICILKIAAGYNRKNIFRDRKPSEDCQHCCSSNQSCSNWSFSWARKSRARLLQGNVQNYTFHSHCSANKSTRFHRDLFRQGQQAILIKTTAQMCKLNRIAMTSLNVLFSLQSFPFSESRLN